jgi:hypothetical protein
LLTPKARDQVKCFMSGFYPNNTRCRPNPNMLKSQVEH